MPYIWNDVRRLHWHGAMLQIQMAGTGKIGTANHCHNYRICIYLYCIYVNECVHCTVRMLPLVCALVKSGK